MESAGFYSCARVLLKWHSRGDTVHSLGERHTRSSRIGTYCSYDRNLVGRERPPDPSANRIRTLRQLWLVANQVEEGHDKWSEPGGTDEWRLRAALCRYSTCLTQEIMVEPRLPGGISDGRKHLHDGTGHDMDYGGVEHATSTSSDRSITGLLGHS